MIGTFVNTKTGQEIHTDGRTLKELGRRFRELVAANGFRRTGWKMIGGPRRKVHGLVGSEETEG